ncbi:MAG TPA: hypothetical protein VF261_01450 [Candidatus Saccharimonadales bacterium]
MLDTVDDPRRAAAEGIFYLQIRRVLIGCFGGMGGFVGPYRHIAGISFNQIVYQGVFGNQTGVEGRIESLCDGYGQHG